MGTRPNTFREQEDPDTPRRPRLGVGGGVDMDAHHVVPLQGWDRINVGSRMVSVVLPGSFSPGGAIAPSMGSPSWGGDSHGLLGQHGWS